eukprot:TRINITY_DN68593_c0_g1_i1.p1 TRINITY_DN68593_c0_g1~~TRINITY_DN68593_c0_g1_i1.p1  ORF type:complete len:109 (+),score=17.85 TRINITY_DN68593_c0_g1_i1:1-327(+)
MNSKEINALKPKIKDLEHQLDTSKLMLSIQKKELDCTRVEIVTFRERCEFTQMLISDLSHAHLDLGEISLVLDFYKNATVEHLEGEPLVLAFMSAVGRRDQYYKIMKS